MWYGVDPMAEKFPSMSVYSYAANNPIIIIDPDGQEWDITETSQGTTVSADVEFSNDANLSKEQVQAYQTAINKQFNETISLSSGGNISGQVTFNGGSNENQFTPSLSLYKGDATIGGMASNGGTSINVLGKDGSLRSPEEVALSAVHELLHTVRLDHPFENTQNADTELKHVLGNNYSTTSNTDPNISRNIMNYSSTIIDSSSANGKQNLITKGQISLMKNEIHLQKQGYGIMPKYNNQISQQANQNNAIKLFINYWSNMPGTPVKRNK